MKRSRRRLQRGGAVASTSRAATSEDSGELTKKNLPAVPSDSGSTTPELSSVSDEVATLRLPDEVLLEVLSWLPAADLLGAVPLVCRQWRRVAEREESWRRVVVEVRDDNCLPMARLLERAPRVRRLNMTALSTRDDAEKWGVNNADAVWEAWDKLEECDCFVDELDICVERDGSANIEMLSRLGPKLKRLTLRLGTRFSVMGREYGQLHLAIKTVGAKMPLLTHLELHYELFKGASGGYDNELGAGCPALTSFTFHFPVVQDYKHWKEVVADVLNKKCGQLTSVALLASDKCPEVPAELWTALAKCTRLRRLSVPVPPGLSLISQLPQLRELTLQPSKHAVLSRKDATKDNAVLRLIERLELHLPPPAPKNTLTKDRMAVLLQDVLATRCEALRSLSLTGGVLPADGLLSLLADPAKLPALVELQLHGVDGLRASHLQQLAAGRLKVLLLEAIKVPLDPSLEASLTALRRGLYLRIY